MKDPLVNIVIPVYNEELRLVTSMPLLLAYLKTDSFPYRHVITIVDNGSTDTTREVVRKYMKENADIRLLSLSEKGKGRAVYAAWNEGIGDVQMFMDVDLATDLSHMEPLIDAIAKDGYEMAVGNRLGPASRIEGRNATRGIFSKIFNAIVRVFFGSRLVDHQCGFKAIRTESFKVISPYLKENGFFFDTELIVFAYRAGYRVRAIDVMWKDSRESKVSVVITSLEMLFALLALKKRLMFSRQHTS